MTEKSFLKAVSNGELDIVQLLLSLFQECGSDYCVIGGLGVNAYVDPVVSLDLDVVVESDDMEKLCALAESKGLKVSRFEHSLNLDSDLSDLRIQLQTDVRYQDFLPRGMEKEVLGYKMKVAALEDVLQGKIWACTDAGRRKSKRQKDLADIARIIESYPDLEATLPESVRQSLA